MASGHPQFGNEGGSPPLLDFGQVGGTRQQEEPPAALLGVHAVWGPVQVKEVKVTMPEIDLAFVGNLGFSGRTLILAGVIRAKDDATMNAIEQEIEARRDGVTRNRTSGTRTYDADLLKPAPLTSPRGEVVGNRVRLKAYEPQGMRMNTPAWPALQRFRMIFESLD